MAGRPWRGAKALGPRFLKDIRSQRRGVGSSPRAGFGHTMGSSCPLLAGRRAPSLGYRCCIRRNIGFTVLFFFPCVLGATFRITAWDFGQERKVLSDIVCHIKGIPDKGACRPLSRCRVERTCRAAPRQRRAECCLPVTNSGLAPHSPGVALGRRARRSPGGSGVRGMANRTTAAKHQASSAPRWQGEISWRDLAAADRLPTARLALSRGASTNDFPF